MAAKKGAQPKRKARAKRTREAASPFIDQSLIKSLGHDLRVRILAILNDRMASPNQLAKELDEGLSQVSYHVNVLKEYGTIELVKTEPRRGAVEHFYRASSKVLIPSSLFRRLPKSAQRAVWADVLADIDEDVSTSIEMGTFDKRDDLVVGRDSRNLDAKACEDAEQLAAEFYERFEQLEVDTDRRLRKGEGDGTLFPITAALLVFGSAHGKKLKPSKNRKK